MSIATWNDATTTWDDVAWEWNGDPEVVTPNTPPVVDAGPDQYQDLPDLTAQLAGVVTDDGQPAPTTQLWTKVSGPSTVAFDDDTITNAVATFGAAGAYVLRLTATDTDLSASDDVRIVIRDPAAPANPATDVGHHFGHGHGY